VEEGRGEGAVQSWSEVKSTMEAVVSTSTRLTSLAPLTFLAVRWRRGWVDMAGGWRGVQADDAGVEEAKQVGLRIEMRSIAQRRGASGR
jgi:hypothetical protein